MMMMMLLEMMIRAQMRKNNGNISKSFTMTVRPIKNLKAIIERPG